MNKFWFRQEILRTAASPAEDVNFEVTLTRERKKILMSSPTKQNSTSMPTKKSALKETVDLLRRQAKMQRMKVSRSAEELMNYCLENAQNDCLLQGIPAGGNPYKEGKNCPVM